jgi:pimeloyl-ACP methyl ester carboxylesterase
MTYQMQGFKFIDRGFKKDILLIHGWATDSNIFDRLDIPFNYILPENIPPERIDEAFNCFSKNINQAPINILGWSMGGFIAVDLVARHPRAFDEIILAGIRRGYNENDINYVRGCLKKNAKAYLYRFYGKLFSKTEKEHEKWFKENLLKKYLDNPDLPYLFSGLDYLAGKELKTDSLKGLKVIFVHGENDNIASLEEAELLAGSLPAAKFVSIKGAGHFPVLREEFRNIFRVAAYAR